MSYCVLIEGEEGEEGGGRGGGEEDVEREGGGVEDVDKREVHQLVVIWREIITNTYSNEKKESKINHEGNKQNEEGSM